MKIFNKFFLTTILLLVVIPTYVFSQNINYNFQTDLPSYIVTNGVFSKTKAAGINTSTGAVTITESQYLEINLQSIGRLEVGIKSSGKSTRDIEFYYKQENDNYILLGQRTFTDEKVVLSDLYPVIKTNSAISIKIVAKKETSQIHDLLVEASTAKNDEAKIASFKIENQIDNSVINTATGEILVNVPNGTNLVNIVPTELIISNGASISPLKTIAQDFSNPLGVNYTVVSEDGLNSKQYTVKVNQVASSSKDILIFKLPNQIGDSYIDKSLNIVKINVLETADLTSVIPQEIATSSFSTISPSSSLSQNFNSDVVYTVTAQDGTAKQWIVSVTKVNPNAIFVNYEAEDAIFTGKTDTQHSGFLGTGFVDFLASGDNSIIFDVCQQVAGNQTLKLRYAFAKDENRNAELFVNGAFVQTINFTRTSTFTDWAEIVTSVNLDKGTNTIKLYWELTDGPNLDNISVSGNPCNSYTLNVTTTNGGQVILSPEKKQNKYFEGESVTLSVQNKSDLRFLNWDGDISGSANPTTIVINANKNVTAVFEKIVTYKLAVNVKGIGSVKLNPEGREYAAGTVVEVSAISVLNSVFQNWGGNLSGSNPVQTITIDANKSIEANFNDDLNIDFKTPIGFAAVTADGFVGPTTGGDAKINGLVNEVVTINGPTEFPKLCLILKNRIKYKNYSSAPLTIILEEGVYDGSNGTESVWGNHMLDIQEQANLTIIGRKNVVFNFGINVKRSHNIIIRNITFQDYYDDGINIGNEETHHIWVNHCTVGHPTTMPVNTEHPDGGIDVKDGASYVTISWTVYRNSWKTGLIGHSDNNAGTDTGRLKVTHFANHFLNTNSRNPRVRFGEVHVLNCLSENVKLYGIAAAIGAWVYAEGNFYLNTRWPMYADRSSTDFNALYGHGKDETFTSKTGNKPAFGLKQVNNDYDDTALPVITSAINATMLNPGGRSIKFDELNAQDVFNPSNYYSYTAFPAQVVKTLIPMFAGANKIDWFPETLPIEFLNFNVITNNGFKKTVKVLWEVKENVSAHKFEVVRIANDKSENIVYTSFAGNHKHYSFIDENPLEGNSYYQLIQYDKNGIKHYSKIIAVYLTKNSYIDVYPNPVDSYLFVKHPLNSSLSITNVLGKKVFELTTRNTTESTLDITKFKNGIYFISINNDTENKVLKFIKK